MAAQTSVKLLTEMSTTMHLTNVPFTLAGDSAPDDLILGSLGVGYAFDSGFRLESTLSYKEGDLNVGDAINGFGIPANVFGPK